jgi:preprotein translocase subunit SecG
MNSSFFSKKTTKLIIRDKILRTTAILIILFTGLSITLFIMNMSYKDKIADNQTQIDDARLQLQKLQSVIQTEEESERDERAVGRSFAPYEEIIPFISLLESIFAAIDPGSKVTIRDNEKQIYINRYADYEVTLNPGNKVELFYKALNDLYQAKYLTKIINYNLSYIPGENGSASRIGSASLTIRLYFE